MKDWVIELKNIGGIDEINIGEIKYINDKKRLVVVQTNCSYEEIMAIKGVIKAVERISNKEK